MSNLLSNIHAPLAFIFVILVIVFVHEYGHYYVAKICGVKVEVFSIGLGKMLWSYQDKAGTLWKICILPIGGYVKMFGDRNIASEQDDALLASMSPQEKSMSFHFKSVYQKIAIVAAGPLANYLLAFVIFVFLSFQFGVVKSSNQIKNVEEKSPAHLAGLLPGDKILSMNGKEIKNFMDIQDFLVLNQNKKITIEYERNNHVLETELTPVPVMNEAEGQATKKFKIGIMSADLKFERLDLFDAAKHSLQQIYKLSVMTLEVIKQMIFGERDTSELGGPIKIAYYSGVSAKNGIYGILAFIGLLSLNLGLMNLLPIPMLDGGHLLFYFIEAALGKPVPLRIQQVSFRIGMVILISLFFFAIFNDLKSLI